jgi:hypothetical protein
MKTMQYKKGILVALVAILGLYPLLTFSAASMPLQTSVDCSTGSPKVRLEWDAQTGVSSWQVHRDEVRIDVPQSGTSYIDENPNRDINGPHNYYVVSNDGGNYEYAALNIKAECPISQPGLTVSPSAITVAPGEVFSYSMTDYFDQASVDSFPPTNTSGYCRRWQYMPSFKANLYNPTNGSLQNMPSKSWENEWGIETPPVKTGAYQYAHYSNGANQPAFDNRQPTEYYSEWLPPEYGGANPPGTVTQTRTFTAPTTPGTYEIRVQSGTLFKYAESYHQTGGSIVIVTLHCSTAFTLYPGEGHKGTQTLEGIEGKVITLNVVATPVQQNGTVKVQTNNAGFSWRFLGGAGDLCAQSACSGTSGQYNVANTGSYPDIETEPVWPPFAYSKTVTSVYSEATSSKELRGYLARLVKKAQALTGGCDGATKCRIGPNGTATYTMTAGPAPTTCKVQIRGTFNGTAKATGADFSLTGPENKTGNHSTATVEYDMIAPDSGALYTISINPAAVTIDGFQSRIAKEVKPLTQQATCYPNSTITFDIAALSKAIIDVQY